MDTFEDNKNKINIREIKSSFVLKNIFSFLSKKQILNMIIYIKNYKRYIQLISNIIKNIVVNIKLLKKMEKEKNII